MLICVHPPWLRQVRARATDLSPLLHTQQSPIYPHQDRRRPDPRELTGIVGPFAGRITPRPDCST